MRTIKLFVFAIIAMLLVALALPVAASPPQENPGKRPPGLTKTVFVHYPRGVEAKGGKPGPPDGGGNGGGGNGGKEEKLWYSYDGTHWSIPSVPFVIKDINEDNDAFENDVLKAFDIWEDTGATIDFIGEIVEELDDVIPSSFYLEDPLWPKGKANMVNEVGWIKFSENNLPSNAIAVTAVWVYTANPKIIAEVDMAMNDDLGWSTDLLPNTYDVLNIATHEAGHWLKLGDLYKKPAREQTMYGYGAINETKKQTLESGDIAGILEIYPAP
jgi:hypothetical protein